MNHFETLLFIVFSGFAIASAVCVVTLKRAVYGILALAAGMVALSGLFVLLQAFFIAVIQVLIYAGAILVLFLFVVMLMGVEGVDAGPSRSRLRLWAAAFLALLFLTEILIGISAFRQMGVARIIGTVEIIGSSLFSQYLFPFELISGVMLVGILGVVSLNQKRISNGPS